MSAEDLLNKKLCEGCTLCCEYISLEINVPCDKEDIDHIIWYLLHDTVVFCDDKGDWYIEIKHKCRELGSDGLCKIYKNRPLICRTHTQEDCEKHDPEGYYEHIFHTPEEFMKFLKEDEELSRIYFGK